MKFYLQNNLYPAGCLKNTHHISPKKIYLPKNSLNSLYKHCRANFSTKHCRTSKKNE